MTAHTGYVMQPTQYRYARGLHFTLVFFKDYFFFNLTLFYKHLKYLHGSKAKSIKTKFVQRI